MKTIIRVFLNLIYMKETRIFVFLFLVQIFARMYHPEFYIDPLSKDIGDIDIIIDKTIRMKQAMEE